MSKLSYKCVKLIQGKFYTHKDFGTVKCIKVFAKTRQFGIRYISQSHKNNGKEVYSPVQYLRYNIDGELHKKLDEKIQ